MGMWEPAGCLRPVVGLGRREPDTYSVFGVDVLAQGQEVLHDLHVPCPHCHVQGGAQQLSREEAGTIG